MQSMYLILYILLIKNYVLSLNYFHNYLTSIDLDIFAPLPAVINSRYVAMSKSLVFEVNDKNNYKIGNVYEGGTLIYPDSDILIYRKVIRLIDVNFEGILIQINSIYCNKINDSLRIRSNDDVEIDLRNQLKEVMELVKFPGDNTYREILRYPFTLNIKPNCFNRNEILVSYHENDTDDDDVEVKVTYDVRDKDRMRYMIGIVKYGDLIIDESVYENIHKGITVTFNTEQGIIVEINKIMKNGDYSYNKCRILFTDSKPVECQLIQTYNRTLM